MDKVCRGCGERKPLDEFYAHKDMADGRLNKCKQCVKVRVKSHRDKNLDKVREYDRNRPNATERNEINKERVKSIFKYGGQELGKILETKRRWVSNNPNKRKAQNAANNAVSHGVLEKKYNCEHCGVHGNHLHKHHDSYEESEWLNVMFLCPTCHGNRHKYLNKQEDKT